MESNLAWALFELTLFVVMAFLENSDVPIDSRIKTNFIAHINSKLTAIWHIIIGGTVVYRAKINYHGAAIWVNGHAFVCETEINSPTHKKITTGILHD